MPMGSTGILDAILQLLLVGFFFYTGKLVLPVISFGWLTVEDRSGSWWQWFSKLPDGRIAVSHPGTSVLGFLIWVLFIVILMARVF